jgi:hypothetical protein
MIPKKSDQSEYFASFLQNISDQSVGECESPKMFLSSILENLENWGGCKDAKQ